MFASLILVLPSEFAGGDAHVAHGGVSRVLNSSAPSALHTTALAWYTDVTHAIAPLTSGFRLALAYNLVHTAPGLRPALSANAPARARLRHVLASWRAAGAGAAPQKVLVLLDHMYSHANTSSAAMKGRDAHVVALLHALAQELGFRLGFANVERRVTGCADDDGPQRYGRGGWGCAYDDEDEDENEVGMLEIYERDFKVEHLVDLEGALIKEKVDFVEKQETIPQSFVKGVEDGEWDNQDYEGYMGNVSLFTFLSDSK